MSNEVKIRSERARIARAAGLVSGLTLVSRVLGLAREVVFAALLGAGFYSDAFRIAFRVPNLLRDMFAEGALSAAFVPTYTRVLTRDGRPAAFQLANRVLTVLALLLGALVVLGTVFAGSIVGALAPGYAEIPGKAELTLLLTRVMMPFLPLVAFAAVAIGHEAHLLIIRHLGHKFCQRLLGRQDFGPAVNAPPHGTRTVQNEQKAFVRCPGKTVTGKSNH